MSGIAAEWQSAVDSKHIHPAKLFFSPIAPKRGRRLFSSSNLSGECFVPVVPLQGENLRRGLAVDILS